MKLVRLFVILALLVLVTPVMAQDNVDKVIVASEANYPDALVSSAVSEKLGIPVLLTKKDELPQEVLTTLEDFNPQEVVVVGGPAVISDSVIFQLEGNYNITRLWEMTRYGTAAKVASHFWPENAKSAILVEDKGNESEILGLSSNLAGDAPILPVPKGKIPASTLNQLKELNVESIKIIGTEISEEMQDDIESIGINVQEKIQNQDKEKLKQRLKNRTKKDLQNNDTMIVVAVAGFKHVISAPNLPQSKSFLVSSQEQISDAIKAIDSRGIKEVKVVGKPELAEQVYNELINKTDAEVDLIVSGAVQTKVNLTKRNKEKFSKRFQREIGKWKQKIQNRNQEMKKLSNETINKARNLIQDYNLTDLNQRLKKAENSFNRSNYHSALQLARKVKENARKRRWESIENNNTAIRDEIKQETQNLRERIQEIKNLNQEFANQMQKNMTVTERLRTIEQFRSRRTSKVRQIVNQAAQMGRSNGVEKWINKAERKAGRAKNNNMENVTNTPGQVPVQGNNPLTR